MKKSILFVFALFIFFPACKNDDENIDLVMLKQKINQNENFIAYSNAQNQLLMLGLTREVTLKNVNRKMIKENIANVKTLVELKELYVKAGLIGAEKLATTQVAANDALVNLKKDFPELKKLNREQIKALLKVESKIKDTDINNSARKILTH